MGRRAALRGEAAAPGAEPDGRGPRRGQPGVRAAGGWSPTVGARRDPRSAGVRIGASGVGVRARRRGRRRRRATAGSPPRPSGRAGDRRVGRPQAWGADDVARGHDAAAGDRRFARPGATRALVAGPPPGAGAGVVAGRPRPASGDRAASPERRHASAQAVAPRSPERGHDPEPGDAACAVRGRSGALRRDAVRLPAGASERGRPGCRGSRRHRAPPPRPRRPDRGAAPRRDPVAHGDARGRGRAGRATGHHPGRVGVPRLRQSPSSGSRWARTCAGRSSTRSGGSWRPPGPATRPLARPPS